MPDTLKRWRCHPYHGMQADPEGYWTDYPVAADRIAELERERDEARAEIAELSVSYEDLILERNSLVVERAALRQEVERLREALVYTAWSMKDEPQHMVCDGVLLSAIPGWHVQVKLVDGSTIEAGIKDSDYFAKRRSALAQGKEGDRHNPGGPNVSTEQARDNAPPALTDDPSGRAYWTPETIAFGLRMIVERMQFRIDAATERKSETVGIGVFFANDIASHCRRSAEFVAALSAGETASDGGEA